MDEPSGGTQRFSGHWILTNVFVTQADILTSVLSMNVYTLISPKNGTLPYRFSSSLLTAEERRRESHSFGKFLSPGHFRRKNALPVSYYALFQGNGCF